MVNAAKAANFNALIVQVRKRGDAYYNSKIVPRATDIAAGYDPLADVITQARALELEVHAWLSVYEVATDSPWFRSAENAVHIAYPEWLMVDHKGAKIMSHGKIYLDPGVPAVQDHILAVVQEVLTGYDVDGIHLDNVRYPDLGSGYNPSSLARFNAETGKSGMPNPNDQEWRAWRTRQVTGLVSRIHEAIDAAKPAVKLSASVMCSDPTLAARQFMQDWASWTKEGLVDFLVPMVYLQDDRMAAEAVKSLAASHGRHVYIGIGAFRIDGVMAAKHISDCRAAGAAGVVLYSYHYLGPNSPGGERARLSDVRSAVFAERTTTAPMAWRQEGGAR